MVRGSRQSTISTHPRDRRPPWLSVCLLCYLTHKHGSDGTFFETTFLNFAPWYAFLVFFKSQEPVMIIRWLRLGTVVVRYCIIWYDNSFGHLILMHDFFFSLPILIFTTSPAFRRWVKGFGKRPEKKTLAGWRNYLTEWRGTEMGKDEEQSSEKGKNQLWESFYCLFTRREPIDSLLFSVEVPTHTPRTLWHLPYMKLYMKEAFNYWRCFLNS